MSLRALRYSVGMPGMCLDRYEHSTVDRAPSQGKRTLIGMRARSVTGVGTACRSPMRLDAETPAAIDRSSR